MEHGRPSISNLNVGQDAARNPSKDPAHGKRLPAADLLNVSKEDVAQMREAIATLKEMAAGSTDRGYLVEAPEAFSRVKNMTAQFERVVADQRVSGRTVVPEGVIEPKDYEAFNQTRQTVKQLRSELYAVPRIVASRADMVTGGDSPEVDMMKGLGKDHLSGNDHAAIKVRLQAAKIQKEMGDALFPMFYMRELPQTASADVALQSLESQRTARDEQRAASTAQNERNAAEGAAFRARNRPSISSHELDLAQTNLQRVQALQTNNPLRLDRGAAGLLGLSAFADTGSTAAYQSDSNELREAEDRVRAAEQARDSGGFDL